MDNQRREFLKVLTAVTSSLMLPFNSLGFSAKNADKWGMLLPLRTLGKTGVSTTMLGLGGYHIGWTTEKDAQKVIEKAIEGGVRFFDTAESYHNGRSETRYGDYLVPKYRDEVFIMTKSTASTGEKALQHLEGSLKRLKCDYVDLWQVHALSTPGDVENRIKNEVIEVFEKAKAQGKVKHIGFTGHQNPDAHKKMLELTSKNEPFETVQMPINVIDKHYYSFIEQVMPGALERNLGILAMKTLSDGRFFAEKKRLDKIEWTSENPVVPNYLSIKEALYYVWSLPVSVLITGAEKTEFIEDKIELANSFVKLTEAERIAILEKTTGVNNAKVEYYKKV